MQVKVKTNPVYLNYGNKPHFLQIFFGGSSSGKSFFLASKIVAECYNGVNWLCCRNVANTIRRSVFNEIHKSITSMGLKKEFRINRSDMVITCKHNGKQILFTGLDDVEKVKSITPENGVLERIFIEEATEIKKTDYQQLKKRLRGRSQHSKHIIMAFNPILRSHWIYQEFFKEWQDDGKSFESLDYDSKDNKKGISICILKTTYKDNLFLTQEDRELLENETDPYYYQVYTLGNFGILGNVVFRNWKVEDLSDKIPHFDNIRCGQDFGWVDPTAMLKLHLDRHRKKIYIFDEVYRQYMTDDELIKTNKDFFGGNYVICDSAEPKTISTLLSNGINALPATKGADSIMRGIRWLQDYEIIIDVRCQAFKNEIEQYHFMEDKDGNVIERPAGGKDHLLDSLRYACEQDILETEVKVGKRI